MHEDIYIDNRFWGESSESGPDISEDRNVPSEINSTLLTKKSVHVSGIWATLDYLNETISYCCIS